jgi:hypothetical protein
MVSYLTDRPCVAAILLVGLSAPIAAEEGIRPAIVVEVFNHASLSADTLTRARAKVSLIYRETGVEVLWTDAARPEAPRQFIRLIIRQTPLRPRVMGTALSNPHLGGGTAVVYHDRVLDVAQARVLDEACVLAYAMAHEMGHLLLPYPSHAITGIMRADWDGGDFQQIGTGSLRFTPTHARAIRTTAIEWSGPNFITERVDSAAPKLLMHGSR